MNKALLLLLGMLVYANGLTEPFDYKRTQYNCYEDTCNYEKYCDDGKERCEYCSNKFSSCFTPRQIPNCTVFCMINRPCPPLGPLPNGSKNDTDRQFWLGETVTVTCDEGFQNIGVGTTKCQENGIWSHQQLGVKPPACEAEDLNLWQIVAMGMFIFCAVLTFIGTCTIINVCRKLKDEKQSVLKKQNDKDMETHDVEKEEEKNLLDGPDSIDTKKDRSVQRDASSKGLPPRTDPVQTMEQTTKFTEERYLNGNGTSTAKTVVDSSRLNIGKVGILIAGDRNSVKQGRREDKSVSELSKDGDETSSLPTTKMSSTTKLKQIYNERDSEDEAFVAQEMGN